MKGMLLGIGALVSGIGCGGRTFLPSIDVGDETPSSTKVSGSAGDDAAGSSSTGLTLVPLMPDPAGFVSGNAVGIVGSWYAFGDGWATNGPPGPCDDPQLGGFAPDQCSSIVFPPSPLVSPETSRGNVCLRGTVARVIGSPPDYADIYGIGLGLDLNNSGVKMPYNTTTYDVVGFQFDITNVPTAPGAVVWVELPTSETWRAGFTNWGEALPNPLPNGGKGMQILRKDIRQLFPSAGQVPPFDPKQVLSIEFLVPSVEGNSIPVDDLCVSDLQAIVQN